MGHIILILTFNFDFQDVFLCQLLVLYSLNIILEMKNEVIIKSKSHLHMNVCSNFIHNH